MRPDRSSSTELGPAGVEHGSIPIADLPGGFDLQSTVESGQTYAWDRCDGSTYNDTGLYGGSAWYHTIHAGEFVRVRQRDHALEWESTTDAVPILRDRFRLEDDLAEITAATPHDPLLAAAYQAYEGMRVSSDPFFPCLIAFICSAQMHTRRIHTLQRTLARTYGSALRLDGQTYHAFPTPEQLATRSEAALRDLGLGYRAPYVQQTAEMIATGELTATSIPDQYEAARDALTQFVGVGQKVADCVCLFSLGYLEAVPLDTWIHTVIDEYYPACNRDSYAATSRAIRERFGPYSGYAQTYVFHYIRHRF